MRIRFGRQAGSDPERLGLNRSDTDRIGATRIDGWCRTHGILRLEEVISEMTRNVGTTQNNSELLEMTPNNSEELGTTRNDLERLGMTPNNSE